MKRHKFIRVLLFGIAFTLSACTPIQHCINFADDPRIFRGVYSGVGVSATGSDEMMLRVEVFPQYVDRQSYKLTGTVTLDGETSVPFAGEASGGDTQLYVLTPPVISPYFEVEFSYKNERWMFYGTPERESGPSRTPWRVLFGPMDRPLYETVLNPVE